MTLTPKIKAFRASTEDRAELSRALQVPAVMRAFIALREAGVPRTIPELDSRNHPDTIVAHTFYKFVGRNETLDDFERLTFPMNEAPDEKEEIETPFQHSLPPELRTQPKPFVFPSNL